MNMIKFELLVKEDKTDEIKTLLREIGIKKILLVDVKEYDEEHLHEEGYRGAKYIVDFTRKIKIEVLLNSVETIERALDMLTVANIDAEVLIYEIMKSYNISKQRADDIHFSFGDVYRSRMD